MEHDLEISGPFSVLNVEGDDSDYYSSGEDQAHSTTTNKATTATATTTAAATAPSAAKKKKKKSNRAARRKSEGNTQPDGTVYCSICLLHQRDISKLASIQGCGHQFCIHCLREWLSHKIVCPLCFSAVEEILTVNAATKEPLLQPLEEFAPESLLLIAQATTAQQDQAQQAELIAADAQLALNLPPTAEDLQCLDATYFLPEIERLVLIAEILQTEAARAQQHRNPLRAKVNITGRRLHSLHKSLRELYDLQNLMLSHRTFDPCQVLAQLYNTQETLYGLSTDPFAQALWDEDDRPSETNNNSNSNNNNNHDNTYAALEDDVVLQRQESKRQKKKKKKTETKLQRSASQLHAIAV